MDDARAIRRETPLRLQGERVVAQRVEEKSKETKSRVRPNDPDGTWLSRLCHFFLLYDADSSMFSHFTP